MYPVFLFHFSCHIFAYDNMHLSLHNKVNLMEELRKVHRIAERGSGHADRNAARHRRDHGQQRSGAGPRVRRRRWRDRRGAHQARRPRRAHRAIQNELGIPIKLVGVGEGADDLIDFDPQEFVDALFAVRLSGNRATGEQASNGTCAASCPPQSQQY